MQQALLPKSISATTWQLYYTAALRKTSWVKALLGVERNHWSVCVSMEDGGGGGAEILGCLYGINRHIVTLCCHSIYLGFGHLNVIVGGSLVTAV